MGFEEDIAGLNEFFFFREFTFSKNTFRPEPRAEVEFADNVIWLDDLAILYQLKERNAPTTTTPEKEKKWFDNDVLGKAIRQIRNTLKYLDQCKQIQLQNGRGHTFDLATASLRTKEKVVIYFPHDLLPNDCLRVKHYESTSAGRIHIFQAADYLGVCKTLVTPYEIHDYLQYREKLINRWGDYVLDMPELVLVGHYLNGDPEQVPDLSHAKYLHRLEENRKDWDLSDVIGKFADRIFESNTPTEYYCIISEIAKLNRNDLLAFKERDCHSRLRRQETINLHVLTGLPFHELTAVSYLFLSLRISFRIKYKVSKTLPMHTNTTKNSQNAWEFRLLMGTTNTLLFIGVMWISHGNTIRLWTSVSERIVLFVM